MALSQEMKDLLNAHLDKARVEAIEAYRAKAEEEKKNQSRIDPQTVSGKEFDQKTMVARAARYLKTSRGDASRALEMAQKAGDHQVLKAMGEATLAGGGALVSGQTAQEVIPSLGNASFIRQAGVSYLTMPDGGLSLPYGATGATATYGAEAANVTESSPTTGLINFTPRRMTVISAVSNEQLADSSGRSDVFIANELGLAMARKETSQLLRGTAGTGPTSLRELSVTQSLNFNSTGTSLAQKTADLTKMMSQVEGGNVEFSNPGWVMSSRTKWALYATLDSNGNKAFPEIAQGQLYGHPIYMTNAVPINLSGTNSEIYFASFGSCVLAETAGLSLDISTEASYWNGSATVSAFNLNQTVYRMILRHDFNARYRGLEVSVLEAVAY